MKTPVHIVILCCLCVYCSSTSLPYDTIVIGLGSAGTTAVSALAKAGKRILALEAQGRVGGRVYTVPYHNGVIELGGEWTQGTNNSLVYDAAVKYNIGVVPQGLRHEAFMSDGSRGNEGLLDELMRYCLEVQDNPLEEPESIGSLITRKLMEYLEEIHPDVLRDKDFVENFIDFMSLVVSNTEAANDWNDVSAQSRFVEIGGHQHMSWHRYGYETFFKILLNTYNNGPGWPTLDIKLNKEVTLIKWLKNSTGNVEVVCKDGDVYRADNVIVTVSLGVLKERYSNLFSPPLPQEKITAIEKMSMGVINKIILFFDEEWLPRGRFYNFLWRAEERRQVRPEDSWVTKIFSCSTPMGSREALTCWTSSDVAKLIETLPEDVVKTKVMEILRKFMGKSYTVPEPVSIMRSNWFSNPFTRGSYSYDNLLVHEYPNARATLGEPLVDVAGVPKVLFAGEATNLDHYATVHGASETGFREAQRLLSESKVI